MSLFMQFIRLSSLVLAFWLVVVPARAQQSTAPQNSFLLTIFLKHDQSKTLDQINEQLSARTILRSFRPRASRSYRGTS